MTKTSAEAILDLPQRYTNADLRHSYTALTREYHPDVAERHGHTASEAQERMSDINRAYEYLRGFFVEDPSVVMSRSPLGTSIESGFTDVDWRSGVRPRGKHFRTQPQPEPAYADYASVSDEDFWNFAQDEEDAPAPQRVPVNVRTVLLGRYVPRIAFVALFALLWWRTFPLLPQNQAAYPLDGGLMGWARLVAGLVYPTYLVVYEVLAGNVSAFVRELANDGVSWVTGTYYDLRPNTSSYACALHKLLSDQVWAVLMAPAVLWLAALVVPMPAWNAQKVVLAALTAFLAVDTLAACVRGGLVNLWTSALGDRVEAAYLNAHARLMRRCGMWHGKAVDE
jgi:hypothetical protein